MKKTKKKKEKIPHMCEGMDHGHLWVRCPKTDSLALIQVPEDGSMTAIEKNKANTYKSRARLTDKE